MENNKIIKQNLISFSLLLDGFLGYNEKKTNQNDFHQLLKNRIFNGDWNEMSINYGAGCELYDELQEGIDNYDSAFDRFEKIINSFSISGEAIDDFIELCIEMYLFTNSTSKNLTGKQIFSGDELDNKGNLNTKHPNYSKLFFFQYLNNGFKGDKVLKILQNKITSQNEKKYIVSGVIEDFESDEFWWDSMIDFIEENNPSDNEVFILELKNPNFINNKPDEFELKSFSLLFRVKTNEISTLKKLIGVEEFSNILKELEDVTDQTSSNFVSEFKYIGFLYCENKFCTSVVGVNE